jgi:hypothetical protein
VIAFIHNIREETNDAATARGARFFTQRPVYFMVGNQGWFMSTIVTFWGIAGRVCRFPFGMSPYRAVTGASTCASDAQYLPAIGYGQAGYRRA